MHDTDLPRRLAHIADALNRLRARGCTAFGVSKHQLELDPPMTEAEVLRFEAERGITLPPGYRAFITTIGRAGAGPYYGLYPPDQWAEFVEWITDDAPADWLARPSPLTPGPNPTPPWPEDADETPPAHRAMCHGLMTLGTQGCTYMMALVITGPSRGRVVYLDADLDPSVYVGRDRDFVAWYARWLDEQLAGYSDTWFGFGPAGDEAALRAIISTTADPILRREALDNLRKLPACSDDLWPFLAGRLAERPDAGERRSIVSLFTGAPERWADRITPYLDDADRDVRGAACRTLMSLAPETAGPLIWDRLLDEPDGAVRQGALLALERADQLDRARLIRILGDPAMAAARVTALRCLGCTPADGARLAGLLDAPDANLRRQAAFELLDVVGGIEAAEMLDDIRARVAEQVPVEDEEYTRNALIRLAAAVGARAVAPHLIDRADDPALHDFDRLEALYGLITLGDIRVAPIARRMLGEHRKPTAPGRGHTRTIAELVRARLADSPAAALRALVD